MFRMGRTHRDENAEKSATEPGQPQADALKPSPAAPSDQEALAASSSSSARVEKPAQATRAFTEAEALAQEIKNGSMSGFVGGSTSLTGQASFKGMLRVDGHLSGTINSDKGTLIVSSGGQVDADIEVAIARINGTVNGNVVATERIELGRTARLHGDIHAPALVIEQGAIFEGNCRMGAPAPVAGVEQHERTIKDSSAERTERAESKYLPVTNSATRQPEPVNLPHDLQREA
jgi:cytoskeletal protein CcmA (bactofilin family)